MSCHGKNGMGKDSAMGMPMIYDMMGSTLRNGTQVPPASLIGVTGRSRPKGGTKSGSGTRYWTRPS